MKARKAIGILAGVVCLCSLFAGVGCAKEVETSNSSSDSQSASTGNPSWSWPDDSEESDSGSGGGSSSEIDYEPKIELEEGALSRYTVNAGESLLLPVASAWDATDGDISADVWIRADMNNRYADVSTEVVDGKVQGTFVSKTAGSHVVSYTVENGWGLNAETSLVVDVVGKTEDGKNDFSDIANLTDGGKYVENFSDFRRDFVKNLAGSYIRIDATEDAVEGNSLIIDYSGLVGTDNIISMTEIAPYFKSGTWKVSFDLKLVSGTLDGNFVDNFYIGWRNVFGDKQSNTKISQLSSPFSSMTTGSKISVAYDCNLVEVANGDSCYFHIFVNNMTANDVVLAYDNFRFEYVPFDVSTKRATLEDLTAEGGLLYDFQNTFTSITGAKPVIKENIEDEAARAAITAAGVTGFSDTVMQISKESKDHEIVGLSKECFVRGYTYTLEFKYYKSGSEDSHLILLSDQGNKTIKSGVMETDTLGICTVTFDYTEEDNEIRALNIYGEYAAYIGYIKISAAETVLPESDFTVKECNTTATQEEFLRGYTYDQSEGNYVSNGLFAIVDLMDAPIKTALAGAAGFGENVWVIKSENNNGVYVNALEGKCIAGYTYKVEFFAYVAAFNGGCVLMSDASGNQNGPAKNLAREQVEGNIYKFTCVVEASEGDFKFMFYPQGGAWELYIGNFTVTAEKTPDSTWVPLVNVGDKVEENFTEGKFGMPSDTANFKIETLTDNQVLHCTLPQGGYTFFYKVSGSDAQTALLQEGRTYSVTFRYKGATEGMVIYFGYAPDGAGSVFGTSATLTNSDEWQTATLTFTVAATENGAKKHLQLYSGSGGEVYLDDLVIECTAVA